MTPARWSWNRRDVGLGDLPAAAIEIFGVGELLDPAAQLVRLSPGSRLPVLEFLDQRARRGLLPLHATVEDQVTGQPEIRQNSRSEVPSEELHPMEIVSPLLVLPEPAGRSLEDMPTSARETAAWPMRAARQHQPAEDPASAV